MKEKSPAFQFYPKDYLSDENVSALTAAEEGFYWRAICHCWIEGSIAADPQRLAKILGKGCTAEEATNVQRLFNARSTNGRLTHKRLEEERANQAARREQASDAGKKSAAARKARSGQDTESIEEIPAKVEANPVGRPFNDRSTDVQRKPNTASASPTAIDKNLYIYTLPSFVPADFLPTLQAWDQLQRQKYRRSVSQVEVDALLMAWDGRLDELKAAMIHSTANGWKNIRANVPEVAPTNGHQKETVILSRRESQQEKQVRVAKEGLKRILEEEALEEKRNAQNLSS